MNFFGGNIPGQHVRRKLLQLTTLLVLGVALLALLAPMAVAQPPGNVDFPVQFQESIGPGPYGTVMTGAGMFGTQVDVADYTSVATATLAVPDCIAGPATIVRAYMQWHNRYNTNPGDDPLIPPLPPAGTTLTDTDVMLAVDGGTPTLVSSVASGSTYGTYIPYDTWNHTTYTADVTALVQPGTHDYTVSEFTGYRQFGFGLHVIYSCPELPIQTIEYYDGSDFYFYNRDGDFSGGRNGPNSELTCTTFPPAAITRTVSVDVMIPGAAEASAGGSNAGKSRVGILWWQSGTGTAPDPLATEIAGTTGISKGIVAGAFLLPEWDVYQTTVDIPPGDEHLCVQMESPDPDEYGVMDIPNIGQPDPDGYRGLTGLLTGVWFGVPAICLVQPM